MDDTDTRQLKGTVTTWFDQKGYGWVTRDDGEPDMFFHMSERCSRGFRAAERGSDRVDRRGRPKGPSGGRQSLHFGGQGRRTDDASNNGGTMTAKQQPAPAGLTQLGGVAGVADATVHSPGPRFIRPGYSSAAVGCVFLLRLTGSGHNGRVPRSVTTGALQSRVWKFVRLVTRASRFVVAVNN